MTIDETKVDKTLKELLQKNLKFQFKNKVFKQGKLLLYQQNNYFLTITFQNNKKGQIKFEIPIPYEIEQHPEDNLIYFDYRLSALAKRKENLLQLLKEIPCVKESRFYNSIMEIVVQPDGPAI